ncbi:hypothetical protein [Fimbriiglobus ruber]|uniref:hypothetical protein n=1 Tax=Fimbriiglobus ruber TaxID=1908690 RepID=UPI000B4B8CEE|nr:hypothetical protein [Fimbriiglobus ruber]
MATAGQETAASATPPEHNGAFTLIDLMHLLIRDGSIAGCAIAGWWLGGWYGAVASLPVGWAVGWATRCAVVFLLAVVLKQLFGGTIWGPGGHARPDATDGRA